MNTNILICIVDLCETKNYFSYKTSKCIIFYVSPVIGDMRFKCEKQCTKQYFCRKPYNFFSEAKQHHKLFQRFFNIGTLHVRPLVGRSSILSLFSVNFGFSLFTSLFI